MGFTGSLIPRGDGTLWGIPDLVIRQIRDPLTCYDVLTNEVPGNYY